MDTIEEKGDSSENNFIDDKEEFSGIYQKFEEELIFDENEINEDLSEGDITEDKSKLIKLNISQTNNTGNDALNMRQL